MDFSVFTIYLSMLSALFIFHSRPSCLAKKLMWFCFFFFLQPLSREYHYGNNFGYIVAFKPFGEKEWRRVTVTNPEIGRYVHKDESMPPSTQYQVKVKAFNNKGDGPFSLTAVIYSAQDGE